MSVCLYVCRSPLLSKESVHSLFMYVSVVYLGHSLIFKCPKSTNLKDRISKLNNLKNLTSIIC